MNRSDQVLIKTMARNGHGGYYSSGVVDAGESEGSDSSGRVDMEITASEDFSIPLRKCISLNKRKHDVFDVPTQVVSVSGISQAYRKGLLIRLRAELEQVIVLQKKVGQKTNFPPFPSSNNIPTKNGNQSETLQRSSMDTSGPGKRLNSKNGIGHGSKRGAAGKFESSRQGLVPSSTSLNLMRQCESLLKRLMSHQFGWVFNTPVDVVKLNLPDYFTVIKHPMDLGTIKSKLASGVYFSPLEFLADVRLTFSNAMTYNPPGNDFNTMADTMSKFFEARWKSIEKKIPVTNPQLVPESSGISEGTETAKQTHPSKRRKIISLQHHVIPEPIVERIMTDAEKLDLGRELESLHAEIPDRIVDFLRENSSNGRETGDDEIEIDIDEFSDETLLTLRKLLDDYLEEKAKIHAKGEPCEIELLNEPGLSNSSMQPCQGAVDEDVDIGGNEPPVSSYPPIEIEKDSDDSFDGEADGVKATIPANVVKVLDSVETEIRSDGKTSVDAHINGNKSVSGLDQLEVKFQHNPNSVDSDRSQDGDIAATEMQMSPNKLYRAAMLNRFADTILKAREKTLVQAEARDPEKLRREKEELEIWRKKEKARLQAEAKAAEDARRRADAEAVAEAKRKREVEREAARQALLKIEKTVEINENSRFLKDLEMLRAAPLEPLPIPVNETSPDDSHDGLGGFKFGGSNPLEQLGLYMRKDEDEEEGEPHDIPNPLEQLGLYMKNDEEEEEEEGELPSIATTSEQHELYIGNNDAEEQGELPSTPNKSEQIDSYMGKDDEEEPGELLSIPNTSKQDVISMGKDNVEEQDEPLSTPKTLEKHGFYTGKDDKIKPGEPLDIPDTFELSQLSSGKDEDEKQGESHILANTSKKHGLNKETGAEESEVSSVQSSLKQLEDDEEVRGESPSIPKTSEQLGLFTKRDEVLEGEPSTVLNPEHEEVQEELNWKQIAFQNSA